MLISLGNRKKSFRHSEMSSFNAQMDPLITTFTSFGRIVDVDIVRTNLRSSSVSESETLFFNSLTNVRTVGGS